LVGKISLTTLLLLAITLPFATTASAVTTLAIPWTTIYNTPTRIEGTSGSIVLINVMINNVTNLFSFQIGAYFDPTIVTCNKVAEGGFLSNNGADPTTYYPGSIDNTNGVIHPYGWVLQSAAARKTGNGKVFVMNFTMKTDGYSDIHLRGCIFTAGPGATIKCNYVDYSTHVISGTQYIVKVVGNAQGQSAQKDGGYYGHSVTQIPPESHGAYSYKGQFYLNITGQVIASDSFAYFNVTIPKSLMTCTAPDAWYVELNGNPQAGRLVKDNPTNTTISLQFTYSSPLASQTVRILSTDIVPEFPGVFFATLLILATLAAALFGKATWSAKRKS
jgi:hypothetical protein